MSIYGQAFTYTKKKIKNVNNQDNIEIKLQVHICGAVARVRDLYAADPG